LNVKSVAGVHADMSPGQEEEEVVFFFFFFFFFF
jgi:hypothetical protein